MIFGETPIAGVYVIDVERKDDERGFFARTWCRDEFARRGLDVEMVQTNISRNKLAGTVRGLHFSWPPSREAKLVRCGRGQVFDVVVDLRPSSPSYLKHFDITLDDLSCTALYIPSGIAHGFQSLVDDCDMLYMMTDYYSADLADGVRFDDPTFQIAWPRPVTSIADRDRDYGNFDSVQHIRRLSVSG